MTEPRPTPEGALTVAATALRLQGLADEYALFNRAADVVILHNFVGWLAARVAPEGVCAHLFDRTVCVAPAGHSGPHITSNERYPHGLAREGVAPEGREPPQGFRGFTVVADSSVPEDEFWLATDAALHKFRPDQHGGFEQYDLVERADD